MKVNAYAYTIYLRLIGGQVSVSETTLNNVKAKEESWADDWRRHEIRRTNLNKSP